MDEKETSSFVSEKIKEKPVNKKKLFRRTFYIAVTAVVFGMVACFTFLVLEPIISNWLYPEKIEQVNIPDTEEEVSPAELLTEKDAEEEAMAEATQAAKEAAEKAAQSAIENAQASGENALGLDAYNSLYEELYAVAESASASLVEVTGVSTEVDWFQETVENENSVSGIAIADNGVQLLILADVEHLSNAESYTVTFYDGTLTEATLFREDTQTGLGIFAVEKASMEESTLVELTYATLGNSNKAEMVGRPVIAIGSPMGDYGSIAYGVTNTMSSALRLSDATYNVMSTDIFGRNQASGILMNTKGEVLGVITETAMKAEGSQLISAICISDIKTLIEKLSNDEYFAYVGVHGMNVTTVAHNELKVPFGAYVSEVDVKSPAMNAGITKGDVIVKVDDTEVTTFREYQTAVMNHTPGDTVKLVIARYSAGEYREIPCEVSTSEVE